jgi:hypothetical protein
MNVVRSVTSGIEVRIASSERRATLRLGRFMRRSIESEPCCSGMSRYGTTFGSRAIVSASRGVTRPG